MKELIYIILFFLIAFGKVGAQELTLDWVNYNTSSSGGFPIETHCVDTAGNVYYGGNYKGETNIILGKDTINLVSFYYNDYYNPGFTNDFFIAKVDNNGNLVWIKNYGSIKDDGITNMIIDHFGNLIVVGNVNTGQFVDFDPDPKNTKNVSGNFLLKLSANGDFVDVYSTQFVINQINKDNEGNILMCGVVPLCMNCLVDFDFTDSLTHNIKVWGETYILKLDSLLNFKWVKLIGNNYFTLIYRQLRISNKNEIVLSGEFNGSIDFDPSEKNFELYTKYSSAYIFKLDQNGDFKWAKSFSSFTPSSYSYSSSIAIDTSDNIYTLGYFGGELLLDTIKISNTTSNLNIFISKMDKNGYPIWVKQLKSKTNLIVPQTINTDYENHLFITGQAQQGEFALIPDSSRFEKYKFTEFILILDNKGSFIKLDSIGCSSDFEFYKSTLFKNSLYLSGYSNSLSNYKNPDGQIIKIGQEQTNSVGVILKMQFCFSTHSKLNVTRCENYTWSLTGKTYTITGLYFDTLLNHFGCDSIVTLNLTIKKSTSSSINESVCLSYLAPNGQILTSSGIYTIKIPNKVGCDSVINLNLTVRKPSNSIINPVVCDSYKAPNGQTFTNSGTYLVIIPNKAGCDSVITINLTVNKKTYKTIIQTSCDSYLGPDNITYSKSGVYHIVIPNKVGCDSVITLNLTINKLVLKINSDTTICFGNSLILKGFNAITTIWDHNVTNNVSFTPTKVNTYTAYGTDVNGCIDTASVKVDFYPTPSLSLINNNPSVICEKQTFIISTNASNVDYYQWYRDGNYILNENRSTLTDKISGAYFVRGVSKNDCFVISDTLIITVINLPEIEAGNNQIICKGEKVQLLASKANNYVWSNRISNGDTIIPLATTKYLVSTINDYGCSNKDSLTITVLPTSESSISLSSVGPFTLNEFTYNESGTYYQNLKNKYGCDSTLTLNLVIENLNGLEEKLFKGVSVYPNPIENNKLHVSINSDFFTLLIYNNEGKYLSSYSNTKEIDFSPYSKGLYWIEIQIDSVKKRFKIISQ